jgi:hypothetical protein
LLAPAVVGGWNDASLYNNDSHYQLRPTMRESAPLALAVLSAVLFYLGSSGQQWRRTPLWPRYSRKLALALGITAWWALAQVSHWATCIAMVLSLQMTCLIVCSSIGAVCAWRRIPPARRPAR